MKKLSLFLMILIIVSVFSNILYPQGISEFACGTNLLSRTELFTSTTFEGVYKPNRTDTINSSPLIDAYFPVLIVFVQFSDDDSYSIWPNVDSISGPLYKDEMIANSRNSASEWWNAYNQSTQPISDYYCQVSRGKFHVIGKSYSVVLDHDASYYATNGEQEMNYDIWRKLNHCYPINWPDFDQWGYDYGNQVFTHGADGNIDFIYKVHKAARGPMPAYSGFSALSWGSCGDFEVDPVNHKFIKHGFGQLGSGITCARVIDKNSVLGVCEHEHGHYISAAGHLTYGRNAYGPGPDAFYSPYEMIYNRYMYPRDAEFGQTNVLGDYSSRNNNSGEIIKVPITETECFLLASRRKVSYWDRNMFGDTAFYDTYNNWEYGKGLYIYHVFNGIFSPTQVFSNPQDMESADGYYRWDTIGRQAVYMNCWTSDPTWWIFKKAEVLYSNDPSTIGETGDFIGDELSLHHYLFTNPDGSPAGMSIKFSQGKLADDNCKLGTDRTYTNETGYFSSYISQGSRWDAWNVGYNEVFSPYSSPNTLKHDNSGSDIFIWFKSLNASTNEASIDIYKVGSPYSESQILQFTPPSRPMGVKVEDYYPENQSWCHPIVKWNHNREPDMLKRDNTKRYKIYRATQPDMNSVPGNYIQIADVFINKDSIPSYIDWDVLRYDCAFLDQTPPFGTKFPARYKIKAFDDYGDSSVFSDFASTEGITPDGGIEDGGDHFGNNDNLPNKFDLSQNYPNPFNPVTNIKYDLPKDIFVTIKIYDILGREIKTLVNEFKQAGRYLISFNGTEFASGIYFYRIQAGNFVQVKRMVLIK